MTPILHWTETFALSRRSEKVEKKLSLSTGKYFLANDIALLRDPKCKGKTLSLLAGNVFLEKKVCAFEGYLVLSQKYTKSFGRKNLALCNRFVPSKVKVYV